MSRLLNNVRDICHLSHGKRCTQSLEYLNDAIAYDDFIICVQRFGYVHGKMVVFDRITSREISTLSIEYPSTWVLLFRLHNWSTGFCGYDRDEFSGNPDSETIFHCYLDPFSIDKEGTVKICAPIELVAVTQEPSEIYYFTSLDEHNADVVALAIRFEEETQVYDISGVTVFPVDDIPVFTIKGGMLRFLIGRTLWAYHLEEGLKQYDLSTGAVLRTLNFKLTYKSMVFKDRFIVDQNEENKQSLRIIDIVNAEEMILRIPESKTSELTFRDVSDDGCMIFIAQSKKFYPGRPDSKQIRSFRIDVPSLADIAKECIHVQKDGGVNTGTSESEDTSEDEERLQEMQQRQESSDFKP